MKIKHFKCPKCSFGEYEEWDEMISYNIQIQCPKCETIIVFHPSKNRVFNPGGRNSVCASRVFSDKIIK